MYAAVTILGIITLIVKFTYLVMVITEIIEFTSEYMKAWVKPKQYPVEKRLLKQHSVFFL